MYCEVKFTTTQAEWGQDRQVTQLESEIKKQTCTYNGQNPQWQEMFSFNYQRLTKFGQKQLKASLQQNNSRLTSNLQ